MNNIIRLEAQDNNVAHVIDTVLDGKSEALKALGVSVGEIRMYPAGEHYRWMGASIEIEGKEITNFDLDPFREEFPHVDVFLNDETES